MTEPSGRRRWCVGIALVAVLAVAAPDARGAAWRGDGPAQPATPPASPTAEAGCPAPTSPGGVLWQVQGGNQPILGAPAVGADGTVYFVTDYGFFAVDCHGRRGWRFDYTHPPDGGTQTLEDSPAIGDDGTLYVSGSGFPGFIFAVRPDGFERWHARNDFLHGHSTTSPALQPGGRVYIGAGAFDPLRRGGIEAGRIFGLEADGRPVLGYPFASGSITSSPAVLADGRVVFAVNAPLVAPTSSVPPTPALVPPRPTALPPTARVPVIEVFVPSAARGSSDGGTAEHGPADRDSDTPDQRSDLTARLLFVPSGDHPAPVPTVMPLDVGGQVSSLAATGDVAVFHVGNAFAENRAPVLSHLVAFDVASDPPRRLWRHFTRGDVHASPVLGRLDAASGMLEVIYLDDSGMLVSLNAPGRPNTKGEPVYNWAHDLSEHVQEDAPPQAPVLGDADAAYVAIGRMVLALRRSDGEIMWSTSLHHDNPVPALRENNATASLQLAPGGILYVGAARGTLFAIGTESTGLDPEALWPTFRGDARNTGRVRR